MAERIPGAGLRELVVEAYRFHGGRVDESQAKSPQTQEHLTRARRAAASVPGRAGQSSRPKKTYKDFDSALDAAFEEHGLE